MGDLAMRGLLVVLCLVGFAAVVGLAVDAAVNGPRDYYAQYEQEGYEAGRQGVPAEGCPYRPGDDGPLETQYTRWKKGWQRGYLERREKQDREQHHQPEVRKD